MRRIVAGLVTAAVLVLGACGGSSSSTDSSASTSNVDGPTQLTSTDVQILRTAVAKQTTEGKAYVACVVANVRQAVHDGTLSVSDVRDWSLGRSPLGVVHDHVTDPAVIAACVSKSSTTVKR